MTSFSQEDTTEIIIRKVTSAVIDCLFSDSSDIEDKCFAIRHGLNGKYEELIDEVVQSLQSELKLLSVSKLRNSFKSHNPRNFVKGVTYTEDFISIFRHIEILSEIEDESKTARIFIDLGCGDGECMFAARMWGQESSSSSSSTPSSQSKTFGFTHILGFELNHARVIECKALLAVLQHIYRIKSSSNVDPLLEVFEEDFTKIASWLPSELMPGTSHELCIQNQYDNVICIMYACATCYTPEVILGILTKCNEHLLMSKKELSPNFSMLLIILDQELESFDLSSPNLPQIVRRGDIPHIRTSWGEGHARLYELYLGV